MLFTDTLLGPRGSDIRDIWGYRFAWTPLHKTSEELRLLRETYDTLAEKALDKLTALRGERDLYTTLEEEHRNDPVIGELWDQVQSVPEWVDWEQIERGQKGKIYLAHIRVGINVLQVFYRYGAAMFIGLGYHSLLGGMGANRIVEVLIRTGGFSKAVARKRMYETTQHILQCTLSLESIMPGGVGHKSSVKVRLLHAAVRKRMMKLHAENPGYYDLERDGIPINDLDSIVTILSFSASLIWISLPRQGLFLREQEIKDYIALWRLIGHYVGCPTDPLATPESARAYTESFLLTEINPTASSRVLSQNIIFALSGQPPSYPSADYLVALTRWLNGEKLADALGMPKPSLRARALVIAQCFFVCLICYGHRSIPYLDEKKIGTARRVFYRIIIDGKSGLGSETGFEMQYVPQIGTKTEAGKMDVSQRHIGGVESRNMKVLVVMALMGVIMVWGGWWILVILLRAIFGVY